MRTPLFKKDDRYVPYFGAGSEMLINRIFRAKQGEVLPRYQIEQGFYVMKVAEVKPAGISSLDEVKAIVENEVNNEVRIQYAVDFANRVLDRMKSGKSLQDAVAADSVKFAETKIDAVTRGGGSGILGPKNPLAAKLFQLNNPGENTGVVKTPTGVGIAVLIEKIPWGQLKFDTEKEQLRKQMAQELQNEVINNFLEELRKKAKIVDNRDKIFSLQ
jgi:peptidyl-prolyl cis-trans isomerase D